MNVLNCLPKSLQSKAKQALHEIWQANTREEAEKAFDLLLTYEPKYPSHPMLAKGPQVAINPIECFGIRPSARRGVCRAMGLHACVRRKTRRQRGFNYLGKV